MLTIRQATTDDIALIHQLAWKIFPVTYQNLLSSDQSDYMMEWMYSINSLKQQMNKEHHTYLLAYKDDACVGYVSVQPQGENLFHLQKIYVLAEYQSYGVGKFLFNAALDYIRHIHPTPFTIELNVNRYNKAVGFYEHMGMHKKSQGDFEIGNGYFMNDYIMSMTVE